MLGRSSWARIAIHCSKGEGGGLVQHRAPSTWSGLGHQYLASKLCGDPCLAYLRSQCEGCPSTLPSFWDTCRHKCYQDTGCKVDVRAASQLCPLSEANLAIDAYQAMGKSTSCSIWSQYESHCSLCTALLWNIIRKDSFHMSQTAPCKRCGSPLPSLTSAHHQSHSSEIASSLLGESCRLAPIKS